MFVIAFLMSIFTVVELNCENLFDTVDDSLKQDEEFLPASNHHWTPYRYWRKVNRIGQEILSCGMLDTTEVVPDLIALTEVENDSVMRDLTKRSLLRRAGYEYVMTDGPDLRGIDVALLYSPFSFRLLRSRSIRVPKFRDFRPTRDILYASGEVVTGDTLHVFVVHAPSRSDGESLTRPYRLHVARQLHRAIDSLRAVTQHPKIIIAGDFNAYTKNASIQFLLSKGFEDVSDGVMGSHGAKGTYRYHGDWGSLDHILCDDGMAALLVDCHINDAPFLLEEDKKYGGVKPRRTYLGPRYLDGFSDHLPLVAVFEWEEETSKR
ncbi:MAG: endonuclease/exonuclease/phosphatase family protein [Prevotella sp.]|jgi:endonuclease/exonuclease/phosphatase family metal-dependent hydrolase